MRFLIVGAGALGGYFGARLLAAGCDVTFLLRPRRVAQLAQTGLVVKSPRGDLQLPVPPHVLAGHITAPFDVVLLGWKAYDLEPTMDAVAPAVGSGTMVLPLLNGMRHLDRLAARFGQSQVLGGYCMINAGLDADGIVRHFNDTHALAYGEQDGSRSPRILALERAFAGAAFDARVSTTILQDMWEKWVFIASVAGLTCLMRAAIGDVVNAGATDLANALLNECMDVAERNGHAVRPEAVTRSRAALTASGSPITASMLKDIERSAPTEADHIIGDLLQRGQGGAPQGLSLLRVAHAHLKAYEARRAGERAAST